MILHLTLNKIYNLVFGVTSVQSFMWLGPSRSDSIEDESFYHVENILLPKWAIWSAQQY